MRLSPAILCICLAAGCIISCKNISITHEGNEYYYYPSRNVYYDVSRSNFLYSLDDGKTWDSLYSEIARPAIDGPRETVYSKEAPVWKDNEIHRQSFNGVLLNIINEESLKVPEPVKVKKPAIKNTPKPLEADTAKKERKKPIKRFFQRLFGKKK